MGAVGIYGGTFDPIHHGHLITAQAVLEQRNLGKILFIPCNISPHKMDEKSTQAFHRLEMIKLAVMDRPSFEVSDYEIKKEGISFTYDTLLEMKKYFSELELIIGYDNIIKFDTWKEPEEILRLAKLVVLKRSCDTEGSFQHDFHKEAAFVHTPRIEISASQIRERIRLNLPIDYLVPENVKEYINKLNLYKKENI